MRFKAHMPLLKDRFRVRFHSSGEGQGKESLAVLRVGFLTFSGQLTGLSQCFAEMAHTLRIRPAVNPVQEFLFVSEKVAGQYALEV
jgi:hypothetical protein